MTTGQFQLLTVILSALGIVFIPLLILMIRIIIKWTRVEDKLNDLGKDLRELIVDKERTHAELQAQMREDRAATDRRLRWLEENVWNRVKNGPSGLPLALSRCLGAGMAKSLGSVHSDRNCGTIVSGGEKAPRRTPSTYGKDGKCPTRSKKTERITKW